MNNSARFVLATFVVCLVILLCPVGLPGCAEDVKTSATLSSDLSWPAVTSQTRPWTRWWWMGSIVNEKDLTTEIEKYEKAGLGGMEITPIYGVKGDEDRFIDYLSPKWMKMLVHTLKEANRLGMGIDMATGNGWPFGGPWVGADDACKNIVHKTYHLKSGERLNEPVSYIQKPMVRAMGHRLNISELKEPISANENLQSLALEQVRFEKPLPLQVLMAYSEQGQILNLTDRVDENGVLDWMAPAGDWKLYALFQGWHGKMVERAGPGGEGNVIDHFSDKALKNYLSRFDRAFVGGDVGSLRAYFNDSYEVDDASGESNWTDDFFEEFRIRRGYDLREHLPALFGDGSPEKNSRIICDYRETISDLLLERFTVLWRQWAESKGATTRNQAHDSPANILDLYAASGIPETEGSDRLGFKLASSAAHVTGKLLASSESATWLGEHFCVSLGDVKPVLDRFFLGGINHIFYHGTVFSPPDEAWPGWIFYASVHFGPTNSFWKDFSALNMYVTRCQSFLQSGRPDNDVLVYLPIYDQWSRAGRSLLQHFSESASYAARSEGLALLDAGYTFDYISDRQIANLKFADNSLQTGGVSYRAIVIPETQLIPLDTFGKLIDLAEQGAAIIFRNNLPSDVPGFGNLDERRGSFRKLVAGLDWIQSGASNIRIDTIGKGRILVADDLVKVLSYIGIKREPMADRGLLFVRRTLTDGKCYFLVNGADEMLDGWIPLRVDVNSAAIYDPVNGKVGLAAMRISEKGGNEIYLQLEPGESCIVKVFETMVDGPLYSYVKVLGEPEQIKGTWLVHFIEGGPELPASFETQKLTSWTEQDDDEAKRFAGTARYTIEFDHPKIEAEDWLLDLGRVCESARVRLNGRDVGVLWCRPFRIAVGEFLLPGKNKLEVEVTNLAANRIRDLDRRKVNWKRFYNINVVGRNYKLFDASDWPLRDSGLLGPVTLQAVKCPLRCDAASSGWQAAKLNEPRPFEGRGEYAAPADDMVGESEL